MVPNTDRAPVSTAQFVRGLQQAMRSQAAPPVRHHCDPRSYVPSTLSNAGAVYVRHDAHRTPLQRPYDGPFRVLHRGEKSYVVNRNGTPATISVDRLKPAFSAGPPPAAPDPPRHHRDLTHGVPVRARRPPPSPDPGYPDLEAPLRGSTTTRFGRVSGPPERLQI